MQPDSKTPVLSKSGTLRLAAAATFAALAVGLACYLLMPSDESRDSARSSRPTVPAPSFWIRDYDVARAEAQQSGKPIFVVIRCEQ